MSNLNIGGVVGTVVHLTSVHQPLDIRIFRKECCSLAAAGHDVTLIVPYNGEESVVDGVRILPVPRPVRRLQRMSWTVSQVYRIARRLSADVYHFHDPELIPVGLLLRQQGHIVIYDAHEDAPRSLLSGGRNYLPSQIKRPVSWLLARLEGFAARQFSGIVSATPAIARHLNYLNPNSIVINNYPLLDELASNADTSWAARENSIAYVGVITPGRGLRQMVEAIDLANLRVRVSLKLAGHYGVAKARSEIDDLAGWQYTQEMGFLDRTSVMELLGTVRSGLVLFHPEPNHVESQPNKLFEYMSAGIPVIASDFPLWRDLIEQESCGLLVNPLDSTAIAEAIFYVITHPDEAEIMGSNGRKAIMRTYNWAVEEKKLLAFYSMLLSQNSASNKS